MATDKRHAHDIRFYVEYVDVFMFENKGFWASDAGLIPATKLTVAPPTERTITASITGRLGSADLSHSITGYPVFDMREGSWDFYINRETANEPVYSGRRNALINAFTGMHDQTSAYQCMSVMLDDDPAFYYRGRVWLDDSYSATANHTKITLKYKLQPFKRYAKDLTSDYLWDDFAFEYDLGPAQPWGSIEVKAGTTVYVELPPSDKPAKVGVYLNENTSSGQVSVAFYKKRMVNNRGAWVDTGDTYCTEGYVQKSAVNVTKIGITVGGTASAMITNTVRDYIDTVYRMPIRAESDHVIWNTFYLKLQNGDSIDHTVRVRYTPEYL